MDQRCAQCGSGPCQSCSALIGKAVCSAECRDLYNRAAAGDSGTYVGANSHVAAVLREHPGLLRAITRLPDASLERHRHPELDGYVLPKSQITAAIASAIKAQRIGPNVKRTREANANGDGGAPRPAPGACPQTTYLDPRVLPADIAMTVIGYLSDLEQIMAVVEETGYAPAPMRRAALYAATIPGTRQFEELGGLDEPQFDMLMRALPDALRSADDAGKICMDMANYWATVAESGQGLPFLSLERITTAIRNMLLRFGAPLIDYMDQAIAISAAAYSVQLAIVPVLLAVRQSGNTPIPNATVRTIDVTAHTVVVVLGWYTRQPLVQGRPRCARRLFAHQLDMRLPRQVREQQCIDFVATALAVFDQRVATRLREVLRDTTHASYLPGVRAAATAMLADPRWRLSVPAQYVSDRLSAAVFFQ